MTETARMADYVLPATTQFEKFEATFFNFEFPRNVFHLRRPVLEPPAGPLAEAEIHARLVEAAGVVTADDVATTARGSRAGSRRVRRRVRRRGRSQPRSRCRRPSACSTARSAPRCRTVRRRRRPSGRSPSAARC